MMASHEAHHHHLLGFSSSSSATHKPAAMPMAFDHHGLFNPLHDDMPPRSGGGDDRPWAPQVSALSLYDTSGHHEPQSFMAAPPSMISMLQQQQPFTLNSSRYLEPVKELLHEFCSLEGDPMNGGAKLRAPKFDGDVKASSRACGTMDYMALERRKARLLSMVEEVNGRYRRYREHMRATEMSFEAVAGTGAAHVYTNLAIRAMSRHFRCLRDMIVGEIHALKKIMGERRDIESLSAAPDASRGNTPRLRVMDQSLRRQRDFQQFSGSTAIESCPWRSQRGLPERAVSVLRSWLFGHFLHPYPNDVDKRILGRQSGLSRSQVSNWFINARVRLWKPMIEEMYTEETKQHDGGDGGGGGGRGKPTPVDHHNNNVAAWTTIATRGDQSYHRLSGRNNHRAYFIPSPIVSNGGQFLHGYPSLQGDGSSGAVSLTLGLQQQSVFASSATIMQKKSSLMIGSEEEDVVVPYMNLMGSELLHDFAV